MFVLRRRMNNIPNFKDKKLLRLALIHRSYLNESSEEASNERLEFLGDSIISFVVSNSLFRDHKDFNEGKLTNLRALLVNTKNLAQVARDLKLGQKLMLSKGEEESGGRENLSLLADGFEALVGALYLDQGIKAVESFLNLVLLPRAGEFIKNDLLKDPKSLLQENIQAQKKGLLNYQVIEEVGPAHAKTFTVGVFINNKLLGRGIGKSKQIAQENAAIEALEKLGGK